MNEERHNLLSVTQLLESFAGIVGTAADVHFPERFLREPRYRVFVRSAAGFLASHKRTDNNIVFYDYHLFNLLENTSAWII